MKAERSENRSARRKRVLVVDRHPLMRRAVARWINGATDLEVCGVATSVTQALREVARGNPDLVLSELALEDGAAFRLVQTLRRSRPRLPVLILSAYEEALLARRSLEVGARGYLMKRAGGPALLAGIHRALRGEVVLSALMARRIRHFTQRKDRTAGAKRRRTRTGRRDSP